MSQKVLAQTTKFEITNILKDIIENVLKMIIAVTQSILKLGPPDFSWN